MAWSASAARDRLRGMLSDGPTDKLRHRKSVLGTVTGANLVFKTQEKRRLTDFSTATAPEGVYVDGVFITGITDDADIGEFAFPAGQAPQTNQTLEATYYLQWFIDSELDAFMQDAIDWLAAGTIDTLPDGLKPGALNFGVSRAYEKLALLWAETLSMTFRLEDQPDPKQRTPAQEYTSLAKHFHKLATDDRNAYYTRQGKSFAPAFATIRGCVPDPVPKG